MHIPCSLLMESGQYMFSVCSHVSAPSPQSILQWICYLREKPWNLYLPPDSSLPSHPALNSYWSTFCLWICLHWVFYVSGTMQLFILCPFHGIKCVLTHWRARAEVSGCPRTSDSDGIWMRPFWPIVGPDQNCRIIVGINKCPFNRLAVREQWIGLDCLIEKFCIKTTCEVAGALLSQKMNESFFDSSECQMHCFKT